MFDTTAVGTPDNTGDEFFDDCEVVVKGRFINQRVAPCPLEVRGAAVAWVDGRLHQWLSTQGAQGRATRSRPATASSDDQVHVITPDVGGGFGAKIPATPRRSLLGADQQEGRPPAALAARRAPRA